MVRGWALQGQLFQCSQWRHAPEVAVLLNQQGTCPQSQFVETSKYYCRACVQTNRPETAAA